MCGLTYRFLLFALCTQILTLASRDAWSLYRMRTFSSRGAAYGPSGMLIDLRTCIGCHACSVAV